jgi:drug/metabolite transporter (DMT)-like permease
MLYPQNSGRRAWKVRIGALAVGFAAASFTIGSVLAGRIATLPGLLVAVGAGVAYAIVVRTVVDRRHPVGRLKRKRLNAPELRPEPTPEAQLQQNQRPAGQQ